MSDQRWERITETRREFLGRVAVTGIAGAVGSLGAGTACAQTGTVPAASERTVPDGAELIDEPLTLRSGDTLSDRFFVVSNRFRNPPDPCIVRVAGNGVKIRNVRIVGADAWQPRWNNPDREKQPAPGMVTRTVGIRIENVRDVSLERVEVEGLPQAGVQGHGIEGGLFQDLQFHNCYHGIFLLHNAPNRRIHVERVTANDMWGPGPGNWDRGGRRTHATGHPSRKRPGGFIGGDGIVMSSLRDSVIADCTCIGELFQSYKVTNPQGLEARGLRGGAFQIQGTATADWKVHKSPARDIWVHDCVFDKGLYHGSGYGANCIQIGQNVADALFERCLIIAAGKDGNAIQLTLNAHARFVGCTIKGFNGARGRLPAHAVDVAHGSTVNEDFEQVNTFVDQQRIRLERNPGPRRPSSP